MDEKYDVVIVGTGAAGLFCALQLPETLSVLMITKDAVERSDSYLAQGGISCLLDEVDYEAFYADTLRAGHGENRPASVENMIRRSPEVLRELMALGVTFDRDASGALSPTREGGHSAYRILHFQDITGEEICRKLIAEVKRRENITVLPYTAMLDLITADNRCLGLIVREEGHAPQPVFAKEVVLATGGLGGLFQHSSNYRHITGDALALALRHNVAVKELHYIQIHPTVLYTREAGRAFLISESCRGEGAKLLNAKGDRFTDELQPRDVVSEAIRRQMLKDGTDHVYLTFRDLPRHEVLTHFQHIYAHCLEAGYDITEEPIPVTPAQHYLMGGIVADEYGMTSMAHLTAIGETANNGVHGKNRLASNSLLESVVFAENAARRVAQQIEGVAFRWAPTDASGYDEMEWMRENAAMTRAAIRREGGDFYEKWQNI